MKSLKLQKFLPGMRVKILDRNVLVAAGYENNSDPEDFLNLVAGKEITIKEEINDFIYTSIEYPDIAIYKVFVEKIVYAELDLRETGLIYGVSHETIRKAFTSGIEKFKKIVIEKDLIEGLINV
jgi:hypothetical protein